MSVLERWRHAALPKSWPRLLTKKEKDGYTRRFVWQTAGLYLLQTAVHLCLKTFRSCFQWSSSNHLNVKLINTKWLFAKLVKLCLLKLASNGTKNLLNFGQLLRNNRQVWFWVLFVWLFCLWFFVCFLFVLISETLRKHLAFSEATQSLFPNCPSCSTAQCLVTNNCICKTVVNINKLERINYFSCTVVMDDLLRGKCSSLQCKPW